MRVAIQKAIMGIKFVTLATVAAVSIACWSMESNRSSAASNEPATNYAPSTVPTPTPKKVLTNDMPTVPKGGFMSQLPTDFQKPTDSSGELILREYGAYFLARGGAVPPKKVVFKDEADVQAFQSSVEMTRQTVGGKSIELQVAAMSALLKAVADARSAGVSITPRGSGPSLRSYGETVTNWKGKVSAGFKRWVPSRVSAADAKRISALTPYEQVPEILNLESKGIYFSLAFDKSIIYSVAPPGTSQHCSGLALDVTEYGNARVRAILAKHGWFQTISSDLPHFTYMGVQESELPSLGLKKVGSGQVFWVPDI
ncbi:MAG: hypothetical protein JNL64_13490 [Blastocatellia bacterium]|nr:hypothetical protein [Blastocatellia bacterium]